MHLDRNEVLEVKPHLDIGQDCTTTGAGGREYRPNFSHAVIVRAPGLLPMLYKPSELAQEFGVDVATIREWLAHGAPHQSDERGYYWIDGQRFAAWIKLIRQTQHSTLGDDEAYCLRCRQPVKLLAATVTQRGKHLLLNGVCPTCGNSIHRGARHGQSD